MIYFKIQLYIFILLLGFSCNKDNPWDCVTLNGKPSQKVDILSNFTQLNLKGNFDIQIYPHHSPKIEILAGENLIPNLEYESEGDLLTIQNMNRCGIIRDNSKRILVKLYMDTLNEMTIELTGNLEFKKPMEINRFVFNSWETIGTFKIQLEANSIEGYLHTGAVNLKINGSSKDALFYVAASNFLRAEELEVENLSLNFISIGEAHYRAINFLDLISDQSGKIFSYYPTNEIVFFSGAQPNEIIEKY